MEFRRHGVFGDACHRKGDDMRQNFGDTGDAFILSGGSHFREAKLERVILHRHLKALLHRLEIDENEAPDEDRWLALLVFLNDRFRQFEEERHRLQRSLDIHAREVQSLYKELTLERDKVSSTLACLDSALILLDAQGRPLLISAEGERLLGYTEGELEGKDVFQVLGLESLLPNGGLAALLAQLRPLNVLVQIKTRNGPMDLELELQPLVRERVLTGCLMILQEEVKRPQASASSSQELEVVLAELTEEDLTPVEVLEMAELVSVEEQAPVAVVTNSPEAASGKGKELPLRILLIESDSQASGQMLVHLQELHHEAHLVEDAQEALELYQERPFDAVMCCEQPLSFSGVELCKRLRQDNRGSYPYFILMTPPGARSHAAKALEAGVDAFLTKPFEAVELAVRLKVARGVQSRLSRVYSNLLPSNS